MHRSLQLHRSKDKADWEYIKEDKRNFWQTLASRTFGVLTPANAITFAGAIMVLIGLGIIANDLNAVGIGLILAGRFADIADGYVAEKTGTKSPLGEILDATTDKVLIFIAFFVLLFSALIPLWMLIIFAFHSILISVITLYGRSGGILLHPTLMGKLAVAASWIIICLQLASQTTSNGTDDLRNIFATVSYFLFGMYMLFAYGSTKAYWGSITSNRAKNEKRI